MLKLCRTVSILVLVYGLLGLLTCLPVALAGNLDYARIAAGTELNDIGYGFVTLFFFPALPIAGLYGFFLGKSLRHYAQDCMFPKWMLIPLLVFLIHGVYWWFFHAEIMYENGSWYTGHRLMCFLSHSLLVNQFIVMLSSGVLRFLRQFSSDGSGIA